MDDLIKRLQEAPDGSRALDALVWCAENSVTFIRYDGATMTMGSVFFYRNADGEEKCYSGHPSYTTSLDAKLPCENIVSVRKMPYNRWQAWHEGEEHPKFFGAECATEPLARRCAALKAKQEQGDE